MEEQIAPEERRRQRHKWTRPELLLMAATESAEGLNPELLAALALRRALGGGVAWAGGVYVDGGRPMGSYLTGMFTELINCRLLALADEDGWGLQRVSATDAGRTRYAQVCGILRRAPR